MDAEGKKCPLSDYDANVLNTILKMCFLMIARGTSRNQRCIENRLINKILPKLSLQELILSQLF